VCTLYAIASNMLFHSQSFMCACSPRCACGSSLMRHRLLLHCVAYVPEHLALKSKMLVSDCQVERKLTTAPYRFIHIYMFLSNGTLRIFKLPMFFVSDKNGPGCVHLGPSKSYQKSPNLNILSYITYVCVCSHFGSRK